MSSIWDYCVLDAPTTILLQNLENFTSSNSKTRSPDGEATSSSSGSKSPSKRGSSTQTALPAAISNSGIDGLQESLISSEISCRSFMTELDSLLHTLGEVSSLHNDVTGRTNSLMFNCENLLEQQHTLQATVDVLKSTLAPFNDVESVAGLLGIPFDARGMPTKKWEKGHENGHSKGEVAEKGMVMESFNIDPRAPEFKDVLVRLSTALKSLKGVSFLDSERYHRWLVQLQCRAASLVARAMRDLLEGASSASTVMKRGGSSEGAGRTDSFNRVKGPSNGVDTPLESTPMYAKFRGLGFRMRELSALLKIATPAEEHSPGNVYGANRMVGNGMYQSTSTAAAGDLFLRSEQDVMYEVKQNYITLRTQLLLPFVLESCVVAGPGSVPRIGAPVPTQSLTPTLPNTSTATTTPTPSPITAPLCPTIRNAYSTLLRVAQMEVQLFDSLFRTSDDDDVKHEEGGAPGSAGGGGGGAGSGGVGTSFKAKGSSLEVVSIIESICNATGDCLRPLIIHENNVDELCRVVNALSDDIKAQIEGLFPFLSLPSPSSSFTSPHSSSTYNKPESERPKNLLRTLSRGLDKTVSDAQERLSYCAEIKMRVEVQFFEPLPSHLAYPGIIEAQEEKKAARLAAKNENKLRNKNHKKDDNKNNNADDDMNGNGNGNGNGSREGDRDDGDNDGDIGRHEEMDDISATWYPPLLHTLSLLSKLYGCLEIKIFEHFASQLIFVCLNSLKKGSEKIKQFGGRTGGVGGSNPGTTVNWGEINGDLFLIRHLLILREQLIPFNIKLQKKNLNLDFLPSKRALNSFLMKNVKNIVNFNGNNNSNGIGNNGNNSDDANSINSNNNNNNMSESTNTTVTNHNSYFYNNSFFLLAREGLPNIIEKDILIKKDLDLDLKNACQTLKDSVLKKIFAGMDAFLAKIGAFAGDFSTPSSTSTTSLLPPAQNAPLPLLSAEAREILKKQDFMKMERVREMLGTVQETVVLTAPEFMTSMKLYVENSVARSIILRPLLQEVTSVQRKMECVLSSCFEAGGPLREIEQLLRTIMNNVTSELSY